MFSFRARAQVGKLVSNLATVQQAQTPFRRQRQQANLRRPTLHARFEAWNESLRTLEETEEFTTALQNRKIRFLRLYC